MNRQQAIKSGNNYRDLNQYYGLIPGTVGTVRGPDGSLRSPPVPAFAPPMALQTVPVYSNVIDLQQGQRGSELSGGHFTVENAYSTRCTTFQQKQCDGTVPQATIPAADRVPSSSRSSADQS